MVFETWFLCFCGHKNVQGLQGHVKNVQGLQGHVKNVQGLRKRNMALFRFRRHVIVGGANETWPFFVSGGTFSWKT